MIIPLHDKNPLKIVPLQIVTIVIIALCVLVFVWQFSLSEQAQSDAVFAFGMIPALMFTSSTLPPEVATVPVGVTLVTYMFMHGSWWHLLGNMMFLWVFGDNIEDSMGHWRFIIFYLLCGIAAVLVHALIEPDSTAPVVGASGAIAGLIGAYLVLHPKVKLLVLVFSRIPLYLPAYIVLLAWFVFQIVGVFLASEDIAWWAHIGGFFAGAILIIPFRYKKIPLLDQGVEH